MRIVIFGAAGMIGSQLFQTLRKFHEVKAVLHQEQSNYHYTNLFDPNNAYFNVDVFQEGSFFKNVEVFKPQVVINAVGIVKQDDRANNVSLCREINAIFPHHLLGMCQKIGARMIHMSTDCVFSGKKGNYVESDVPDAEDLYGCTKIAGEVLAPALTLRTSTIGLELKPPPRHGLIEWFLSQRGKIRGFRRAIYTGLTTLELARIVNQIIVKHPNLSGLWHVASEPIDKFTLLSLLAQKLKRADIDIIPDDDFVCDRSLSALSFVKETGYHPPSWDIMLDELAEFIYQERKW